MATVKPDTNPLIARAGAEVTVLDLSPEMLARTERR